jgi:hypothetical protein
MFDTSYISITLKGQPFAFHLYYPMQYIMPFGYLGQNSIANMTGYHRSQLHLIASKLYKGTHTVSLHPYHSSVPFCQRL